VGNTILNLGTNLYVGSKVRITHGAGAGQERIVTANGGNTVTVDSPWSTVPDASSRFVLAEGSWRSGAIGSSSPIRITVPERIGAFVHVSARAANVAGDEAEYDLSPVTRWLVGQSGGLLADAGVPTAPLFGVTVSGARAGVLDFGPISFPEGLQNSRSITSATYKFHYYDEVQGAVPSVLGADIDSSSTILPPALSIASGTVFQVDREVMVAGPVTNGVQSVQRGAFGTPPATHSRSAAVYYLGEKVAVVPFPKGFFGSPASGDWKYSFELPNVRVASVEMFLTNTIGDGPVGFLPFTGFSDQGLRTLSGGQYSFQIGGYLSVQTSAAPSLIVDADRAVRDIYGILGTPASGAGVTLQVNRNGRAYSTVQFQPGSTTSIVTNGFGLPALRAGDVVSLDVTGVGTINPGSDLTLAIRS
jgi:hypothetical protein